MKKWSKEFPKQEGYYWFYGYRYGKISCGSECKPELMFVEVNKIPNGFMYVADGQFMYEKEVEEPYFLEVDLPELPKLK